MRSENYQTKPLSKLVDIYDSMRVPVKKSERKPGPYPYYGASGIADYVDSFLFDGEYLLLAEDGENLKTQNTPIAFIANGRFWVNNHAHILQANTSSNTRYLSYALQIADIRSYLSGSTRPKLTQGDMKRIQVYAPQPKEQQAIAHILGTLDDKIELNRQINQTLEEMARALFKSWFVDFDPVRAKAAGKQPPGLKPEIADLFPDSFVDSELGEISKGWEVIGLSDTGVFLNGLALQKYPASQADALPVIKIAQLHKENTDGADQASKDIPPEYVVNDGDILFSWSGSLECVLWTGGYGALNQHLFKVTSDKYPKWFQYLWIHHHMNEFRAIASGKATTMGHIQRRHLDEAKVLIPTKELINLGNGLIGSFIGLIIENSIQSKTLIKLRDTLLPKLISGELRVKDAERIIQRSL